jgi:hypothetical protein
VCSSDLTVFLLRFSDSLAILSIVAVGGKRISTEFLLQSN